MALMLAGDGEANSFIRSSLQAGDLWESKQQITAICQKLPERTAESCDVN